MIIRINQPYLKQAMQEIILNGLQLGKTTVTKGKAIYPTPSGMNIKIPQNPFLNSYNQAAFHIIKKSTVIPFFILYLTAIQKIWDWDFVIGKQKKILY